MTFEIDASAPTDARTHFDAAGARCLVVVPDPVTPSARLRTFEERAGEARGLAEAIDLHVVDVVSAPIRKADPARFFGGGKVEEFARRVEEDAIVLITVDADLSPVQQRNLERALQVKVLDRTGLILEIFGARAQTREGRLQSELAHLRFQRSRLVRSWTHLERQRGGAGFMGGPGETQIEADRRILAGKIRRLEARLADVRRTRGVQRASRNATERPVVALVGYTNAGKSTLFNRLAGAQAIVKDQVFQTLDPTLRVAAGPKGDAVILADTVGFVSDLPTLLVDAFKATLEEAATADILLHVRDVSSTDSEAQAADVIGVLAEIGVDEDDARPVIEVWNKIDRIGEEDRRDLEAEARRMTLSHPSPCLATPWACTLSATGGEGLETLWRLIAAAARLGDVAVEIVAPMSAGGLEAWLRQHGRIDRIAYDDDRLTIGARLSSADLGRLRKRFPEISVEIACGEPALAAE